MSRHHGTAFRPVASLALALTFGLVAHPTIAQADGFTFGQVQLGSRFYNVLRSGDINGDGKRDVVGLTTSPSLVSVFLGRGDGTFDPPREQMLPYRSESIAVADLNGDGRSDVAVAMADGPFGPRRPLGIYTGNPDGTLGALIDILPPRNARQIEIANVVGDAAPDLIATAASTPYTMWVVPGLGDGTFGTLYEAGTAPGLVQDLAASDLDHDGDSDLLFGGSIMLGNGDGTFAPGVGLSGSGFGTTNRFTHGDFDGDGTVDLAMVTSRRDPVTGTFQNPVTVALGKGDGTFGSIQDYAVAGTLTFALANADLTGDGLLDLAMVGQGGGTTLHVLVGRGGGVFGMRQDLAYANAERSITAFDWNADGKGDLAVGASGAFALTTQSFTPTLDRAPILSAPSDIAASPYDPVRLLVRVSDPDSDPIQSLTADLSGLPSPNDATFTASAQRDEGELRWMPRPTDAGTYTIQFEAANALSAVATTRIHVAPPTGSPRGQLFQSLFQRVDLFGRSTLTDFASGDLNRDGHADIVATANSASTTAVLLGQGDGSFETVATLQGISGQVLLRDLNGDGALDAVIGTAQKVTALLGLGDGAFLAPVATMTGAGFGGGYAGERHFEMSDLNRDLKPDLVVLDGDLKVAALLSNGDGTFQAKVSYDAGHPEGLLSGDVDEDGVEDILTLQVGASAGVGIMRAPGDGTLAAPVLFAVPAHGIAIGDVNGDGHLDVAARNYDLDQIAILLGAGNGSFQPAPWGAVSVPSAWANTLGDLNGDARDDLIAYSVGGEELHIIPSGSDGSPGARITIPVDFRTKVVPMEINEDGKMDLLRGGESDGVDAYFGNGDGTFGTVSLSPAGGVIALGKLNADALLDLAGANTSYLTPPWVSIRSGLGDGTFSTQGPQYGTGFAPYDVVLGDVNGDQVLDLVVANSNEQTNAVSVLLGNGDGSVQAERRVEIGDGPWSVALADFNRDGKLDIAAANFYVAAGVRVALGNGDGTFGVPTLVVSIPNARSVAAGDLNGDGIPDIAVPHGAGPTGTGSGSGVSVRFGTGDGTFTSGGELQTAPGSAFVTIADVNRDARGDLLVGTASGISVILGSGQGAFFPYQQLEVGHHGVVDVAPTDVDGDGVLDLVAVEDWGPELHVLLGSGTGSFGRHQRFGTGPLTWTLAMGDLNGDALPDAVVGHVELRNFVSVHLNLGPAPTPASEATATIEPHTLNLKSRGGPMTVRIELPIGMSAALIDPASVRINGTIAPLAKGAFIEDHDRDGIEDLALKFERAAFAGLEPGDQDLTVTGDLVGADPFSAVAHLRVIRPGKGNGPLALRVYSLAGAKAVRIDSEDEPGTAHDIHVCDVHGRLVRQWRVVATEEALHTIWDGRAAGGARCGSGIYFIRVDAGGRRGVGRAVLVK